MRGSSRWWKAPGETSRWHKHFYSSGLFVVIRELEDEDPRYTWGVISEYLPKVLDRGYARTLNHAQRESTRAVRLLGSRVADVDAGGLTPEEGSKLFGLAYEIMEEEDE